MKILIATGIYPPTIGGPATYSKLLFDELPKKNITVQVISFDEVRHLPKVIRHLVYFWKIFKAAVHADIVYAQDPVSVGFPSLCAAQLRRKKYVLKVVGDYAWEQGTQRFAVKDDLDVFSTRNSYAFTVRVFKWIETFVAHHADKIIVPSNYLKKIVSNWGVDPMSISVVYNAFEQEHLPQESFEKLREKFGFHAPVVISVGRLVPWKGFSTLIDVVAILAKEIKDIKLLIVGDGPDKIKLQKKIEAMKLSDTVMLTGKLPQTELFTFIKASDVFVLNTQYEGFSHQLLEVMALGTPIITTEVGGNVELILHDRNGLLTAYNDTQALVAAVRTILKVEGKGKALAREAKETVSQFSESRMIEGLLKELNSLL